MASARPLQRWWAIGDAAAAAAAGLAAGRHDLRFHSSDGQGRVARTRGPCDQDSRRCSCTHERRQVGYAQAKVRACIMVQMDWWPLRSPLIENSGGAGLAQSH